MLFGWWRWEGDSCGLANKQREGLEGLEGLERLERLERLEGLEGLEGTII